MFPRTLCRLLCLFPAYSAPAVTAADAVYKWVDASGITNYSNVVPPSVKATRLGHGDSRVSFYTPDEQLAGAIAAERARAIDDLRSGRRARELEREWLARQHFAALRDSGPADCGACMQPGFAYAPGVVVGTQRGHRNVPQIQLTPGVTAGHVTGNTGYIPGTSAFAPPAPSVPRVVTNSGVVVRLR